MRPGRNLAGKVGLFPQSYTTAAVPTTPPTASKDVKDLQASNSLGLQALAAALPIVSPAAANDSLHVKTPSQSDGEVMKATMTDVQKAIEQLGRNDTHSIRDDARSFSFASMRTGDGDMTDPETDIDIDTDRETDAGGGDDWHRDARSKLAEEARKVVEAQRQAEEEDTPVVRNAAPPIEVELSDESEGEDDNDHLHHHVSYPREHPLIPEDDEEAEGSEPRRSPLPAARSGAPSPDVMPVSTPIRSAFTPEQPARETSPGIADHTSARSLPTPTSPRAFSPSLPATEPARAKSPAPAPEKVPLPVTPAILSPAPRIADPFISLPSPAASSIGQQQPQPSKHDSLASSGAQSNGASAGPREPKKSTNHPSEWSLDEVVDWLRSKGFGDDVCDKFIEQEITGDVLLDLDVNMLKTEIGIPAFGKRMRIANAITDLRRPPSVVYSDHVPAMSPITTQPQSSYGYSHARARSVQSSAQNSLNSPMYGNGFNGLPSAGYGSMMTSESAPQTSEIPNAATMGERDQRRISDPISSAGLSVNVTDTDERTNASSEDRTAAMLAAGVVAGGVGVGLGVHNTSKNRPAQLTLSGSDTNLRSGARAVGGNIPEENFEDERAFMSDNETGTASAKSRRRIFGRSTESGGSSKRDSAVSKNSEGLPVPSSPLTANPKDSFDENTAPLRNHRRAQKSYDASKPTDRLSLFANPFHNSIGKSRKPAPRYSSYDTDTPSEKTSSMSLSRLYGSTGRKSSAKSVSDAGSNFTTSPKKKAYSEKGHEQRTSDESTQEFGGKKPELLRKRTPASTDTPLNGTRGMQTFKPGQSVLQQIGKPDHSGWMRKKGDRYNSWKTRYFILKGSHMYILKSDAKTETKIKGYINIQGYKVLVDENTDPGRYGFRIMHESDKTHYFSSSEQNVIREWMKAIMKSTIGRDYSKAVVSSCNIPTIPLTVAQAMSPAPRPPSPTARAATQKAHRSDNPSQLTSRDARILMGFPPAGNGSPDEQQRLDQFFKQGGSPELAKALSTPGTPSGPPAQRPVRDVRRASTASEMGNGIDAGLVDWANTHLPPSLRIADPNGQLCGGLGLLRIAESVRGKPASPLIPDSAFPSGPEDDKLDGLFQLFDFLLDNDVKTGSVSINEVRQGKRDKIIQLLKALKAWDDKRKAIAMSMIKGQPRVQ
ncbi:hypothetical protein HWV62_11697 [Athelia sp. TMB]|nr:hypothetical protein HWV62_11697 [Athelia sp. TMB]